MEANPVLFRDLTYIFLAALVGGLMAWRLRMPLILGFVVGGIVISPCTPGPKLSDLHSFEVFAEVGVVLLMFSIGVEFSIPELMRCEMGGSGGRTNRNFDYHGPRRGLIKVGNLERDGGGCHRCVYFGRKHNGSGTLAERYRKFGGNLWPSDARDHSCRGFGGRLGYGDIVPMTAQARSLSVLEAVSGIMYIAVLIARLVGLHAAVKSQVSSEATSLNTNSERMKEQIV